MQITRKRVYFAVALCALCAFPFAGGCSKADDTPTDAASPAAGTAAGGATAPTATENQGGVEKSAMPGGGPGK